MTQQELLRLVAARSGRSKREVKVVLDAFKACATQALQSGDRVSLSGFCAFTPVDKPGRPGRNPRTGEAVYVRARRAVRIKPLKALRDAVDDR